MHLTLDSNLWYKHMNECMQQHMQPASNSEVKEDQNEDLFVLVWFSREKEVAVR